MRRNILISCLILISAVSFGQVPVTFTLDVSDLENNFHFVPGAQARIFIRGSFNDWEGTEYELLRGKDGTAYLATFEMPGKPGDTLSYKYVIEKEPGRIFWEKNPNPSNPEYGNRILVLEEGVNKLPGAQFQPDEYFSFPVMFSCEKLQADFRQFRSILEETHPALYDYTDKGVLDSLFESNYKKIDGEMDFSSFLILMTEVISQVGCGHSSLWIPGAFWNVAPHGLFPLMLHVLDSRVYVKGYYSDEGSLSVGSEILTINGEPVAGLVKKLEALTSSDGLSPAFRTAKVAQYFSLKYALAFGFKDFFEISFRAPGEEALQSIELQAVSKESIDRCKADGSELSLELVNPGELEPGIQSTGSVALLTINTFGYYGQVDMFRAFLDSAFSVIDSSGIDKLILDLRGNGGGDPFCSSYLWAYLEPEPLPYFEDHYGRYDTLANPIPQAPLPYRGKLYTLIDGLGFSTTGHLCGLLKYHRVGFFVGSESGATYTCTGNATYPALDQTGIMVGTARVMRYTAAVTGLDPRRGILPDYPVNISQIDLVRNADPVLKKALELAAD